jgi:co-chaperonin GroES (HSP10)
MRLECLSDNVLIEPVEEKLSATISVQRQDDPLALKRGYVVGIGPGRVSKKGVKIVPPVSLGDRVVFRSTKGTVYHVGERPIFMVKADEIDALDMED